MAWMLGDGFDFYSTMNDALPLWSTVGGYTFNLTTGRFTGSQAVTIPGTTGANYLTKTGGTNSLTHHVVFSFLINGTAGGTTQYFFITFVDGSTAQCSVVFRSDGAILFMRGSNTGTVLETFTGGLTGNVWYGIEIEVTVSATAGAITIRLNGASTATFSATGLNTVTTADNYANGIWIGSCTYGSNAQKIDDFVWFTCDGAAPNTWVGDIRSVQQMPNADTSQKQFTPYPTVVPLLAQGSANSQGPYSATANTARWTSVAANQTGTVMSLQCYLTAAATGHAVMALYDATGLSGGPGNLLATSAVVTNPIVGGNTFTVPNGPLIANGATYWAALLSDVTLSVYGGVCTVDYLPVTYASGFPLTALGFTNTTYQSGLNSLGMVVGPANSCQVNEAVENGDTTYVADSNAGDSDLYLIAPLASVPAKIIAVQTRGYMRKSDTGARSGAVQLKSGTTTVQTTPLVLATTYQETSRVDTVDPNTGAAWSSAGVNALQIGPVTVA